MRVFAEYVLACRTEIEEASKELHSIQRLHSCAVL